MLRMFCIALVMVSLLLGCSCGCDKTGPTIENNPQPAVENPAENPASDKSVSTSNTNSTDCGCGS